MNRDHQSGRYLFIDLSDTPQSALIAFLEQAESRLTAPRCQGTVHWLFSNRQFKDFLEPVPEDSFSPDFADFFRRRKNLLDQFFVTNPSGFDWNALFPNEAAKDIEPCPSVPTGVWLKKSSFLPAWCRHEAVIASAKEGLHYGHGLSRWLLPWSKSEQAGVDWRIPGQILVSQWPVGTFDPLPSTPRAPASLSSPFTPELKASFYQLGALRSKPDSVRKLPLIENRQYPGLGDRDAVDFEQTLGGVRKRSLVANMQGVSDLREDPLRVVFQGGRLRRLVQAGNADSLIVGADSYVTWGRQKHSFRTINAFSFEGDFSWGLRENLILEHPDLATPGRLILDYFFVQESPEFFVSATVRWPRWRRPTSVEARAVLELEAFAWKRSQALTARSIWNDGSVEDYLAGRKAESRSSWGVEFQFSAGESALVLGFPQNQNSRPYNLEWKTRSARAHRRLVLNPEGSWQPIDSDTLGGWEEHFSFFLSLPGSAFPCSVSRKTASELIPPYAILDTAKDPA
ncbi:MAG: hypothetical protein HKM06_09420 [Spirochaetales bacterium]|nr:hypothetical protein [Spirochaetales bacterium]